MLFVVVSMCKGAARPWGSGGGILGLQSVRLYGELNKSALSVRRMSLRKTGKPKGSHLMSEVIESFWLVEPCKIIQSNRNVTPALNHVSKNFKSFLCWSGIRICVLKPENLGMGWLGRAVPAQGAVYSLFLVFAGDTATKP